MTTGRRRELVNRLVDEISALPENDADRLLKKADATHLTPEYWSSGNIFARRSAIKDLLREQSDGVLVKLAELVRRPSHDRSTSPLRRPGATSRQDHSSSASPPTTPPSSTSPQGSTQDAVTDSVEPNRDSRAAIGSGEDTSSMSTDASSSTIDADGPIFVVHGHDHSLMHYIVRVAERTTSREVIVLHEQANAGMTLIEKFERHGAQASFAIIILTGDDRGESIREGKMRPRARQNVVFELGFFFGKLGRSRVAVIAQQDVERPSDVDGLAYILADLGGAWKLQLARELRAANIEVNYDRMP